MLVLNSFILAALDFYIFFALKATSIKWVKTKAFTYIWWAYSVVLLTSVWASFKFELPLSVRSVILVAFFITAVCKFLFFAIILIDDFRRGGVWIARLFNRSNNKPKEPVEAPAGEKMELAPELSVKETKGISRSDFLMKSGILIGSLPALPLSWGVISGAHDYRIKRVALPLKNLPKAFHGFRIAQISDVHSGSFYNKKAVLGGVEMLLKEKADTIFFTGDLVNNKAEEMREYQDIFSKLKADFGVYSILGNHDYGDYYFGAADSPEKRRNLQKLVDTQKVMGWDLLRDEHRSIQVGNDKIALVGVENWGLGRFPKKGDLQKALSGVNDEYPVKLLLSHDPSHWKAQVLDTDIDVMFAGHTHGMQFGVRAKSFQWSPAQYIYKEWAGLYTENDKSLYVNVGYGFLGYPGRVGILPEITIFELQAV